MNTRLSISRDSPQQNRILAALSERQYARLANDLEIVNLASGQVLYEAGDLLRFVYFPTTCVVSLVFTTEDGSSAELAMTGHEGVVGIPLVLGGEATTHRVVVRSAGVAYRLRAEAMEWELDQTANLQRISLCYVQALMTQLAQSVVCSRHHAVDQQLCRWLLLCLDQSATTRIETTQGMIAGALGVRREAINKAAGNLQAAGLIEYSRGQITVIDRAGLEALVCECYRVVRAEYDRLFLFHLLPVSLPKHQRLLSPAVLRERAEARLKQNKLDMPDMPMDPEDLVHELQVRQVELEMLNEELSRSFEEANALRERYADIYNFAPVGYFTLDAQGVIFQLNLAGAILLGLKGSHSGRYCFSASVKPEYVDIFNRYLVDVLAGTEGPQCEVVLLPTDQRPEATVRIRAVKDASGRECRMVVTDITAEKLLKHYQENRRSPVPGAPPAPA